MPQCSTASNATGSLCNEKLISDYQTIIYYILVDDTRCGPRAPRRRRRQIMGGAAKDIGWSARRRCHAGFFDFLRFSYFAINFCLGAKLKYTHVLQDNSCQRQ